MDENEEVESIQNSFLKEFNVKNPEKKLYIIIDEYDHFANELLSFDTDNFVELVSQNGKVRKWYEVLKSGTTNIVERIFITGVAPITLDSLTSGFNIDADLTMDRRFCNMLGFTENELIKIMESQQLSTEDMNTLLPIMKENYDGYKFTKYTNEKLYNSNMCLYFLEQYVGIGEIPENLVDKNIASDYSKIRKLLELCVNDNKLEIIEDAFSKEGVMSKIINEFNPDKDFEEPEMISLLYYLGYLTIVDEVVGFYKLTVPNKTIKELYADYFMKILNDKFKMNIIKDYQKIAMEILLEGKIDKLVELAHIYLNNLSNRDYSKFDEKYVKLIIFTILMSIGSFRVKSEIEVNRKYPDLLIIPREADKDEYSIMIELKYLKKSEENLLETKKEEAKKQILEYANFEEIQKLPKLKKYTIVAVNDELYVDEIKYMS